MTAALDPLAAFADRAAYRARLWHVGGISLHDATDDLEADARRFKLDVDAAQAVMAAAFAPFRNKPMSDIDLEDDALYEPDYDSRERDDAEARKGNGQAKQAEFPLVRFDDIALDTAQCAYSVKGLLPRRGLVVLWSPPKCGKSFKATDIGLNSTNAPSPISLTIRPEWAAITGSISSRLKVFRRARVLASSIPMRRE